MAHQPQNLVATPVSATSITLSWDDVGTLDDELYDIERDGVIIEASHAGFTFTDTGLSSDTSYTYRVRAVGGTAPTDEDVTPTTVAAVASVPSITVTVSGVSVTVNLLTLAGVATVPAVDIDAADEYFDEYLDEYGEAPAVDLNILTADNTEFEGGVGDWISPANSTVSSDATWAYAGTKSLKVLATATSPYADLPHGSNMIPITPGQEYRVSMYVTQQASIQRDFLIDFATFTSGHSFITTHSLSGLTGSGTAGVWTLKTYDFTVGGTAVWGQIRTQSSNMVSSEIYWLDTIRVEPI